MGHGGKPWVADFNHPHFGAGRTAMKAGTSYPNDKYLELSTRTDGKTDR